MLSPRQGPVEQFEIFIERTGLVHVGLPAIAQLPDDFVVAEDITGKISGGLSRGCSRKRFKASKDGVATVDPRTANDARRLHAMNIPTGDARQNMLLTNRSFRS